MAVKEVDKSKDLKVNANSDVFLTITIKNAQIGGNFLAFQGSNTPLSKGLISKFPIGNRESLLGRTLEITTNVLDTNVHSNDVEVDFVFESCNPHIVVFEDSVKGQGDILSLLYKFTFV